MNCLFCNNEFKKCKEQKFCSRSCSNKNRWMTGNLRKCQSLERNNKIRNKHTGMKRSMEHKLSIATALKGKIHSETHCQANSIAIKKKWEDPIYLEKQKIARIKVGKNNIGRWVGDKRPNTSISVKESYNKFPYLRKLRALQFPNLSKWGIKGYYVSSFTNQKEYFHSLLELARMIQLDDMNVMWTKKHSIAIEYFLDNKIKYYIPDFLVGNGIIEEVKRSDAIDDSIVKLKNVALIEYCKENNCVCKFVTEKEIGDYYKLSRYLKELSSFKTQLTAGIPLEIEELLARIEIISKAESFKNTSILGNQQPRSDEDKVQRLSKNIIKKIEILMMNLVE